MKIRWFTLIYSVIVLLVLALTHFVFNPVSVNTIRNVLLDLPVIVTHIVILFQSFPFIRKSWFKFMHRNRLFSVNYSIVIKSKNELNISIFCNSKFLEKLYMLSNKIQYMKDIDHIYYQISPKNDLDFEIKLKTYNKTCELMFTQIQSNRKLIVDKIKLVERYIKIFKDAITVESSTYQIKLKFEENNNPYLQTWINDKNVQASLIFEDFTYITNDIIELSAPDDIGLIDKLNKYVLKLRD